MKTNELVIDTTVKDGKTYQNIKLENLGSGDKITVKKITDVADRKEKVGTKFNPNKKWTMCKTSVEYKGQRVGLFFPQGWSSTGFRENVTYADDFDKAGKTGDTIEISVVNGFGKDSKGKDIVVKDYTFKKV